MFECFEFENGGKRNGGRLGIKYRLGATVTLIQLNQLTESQPESAVKFCF